MQIKLDINHMMNDFLGGEGLDRAQVEAMAPALKKAHAQVEANRGKGMQGWMDLPYNQGEIVKQIEKKAAEIREGFDAFVVLGIGGSALGPAAVHQALSHLHYNELPDGKRPGPRLYIEDNIDPERMASLLDVIDIKKTCFNVITKSGGTAETMSQYLIVLEMLKKAVGEDFRRHILITTSKTKGFLIKIAEREGYDTFFIPESVGGRFSELSPVGLIAAARLRHRHSGPSGRCEGYGRALQDGRRLEEPGAPRRGADGAFDGGGQECVRHAALCRFPEADERLVRAAVGGKPWKECDAGWQALCGRPDAGEGAGCDRSALAASAVHRRSGSTR